MGIVYEAEDEVTHRRLAIKVMHPENQVSTDNVRRFMNEAHAAGRVQHPNIVEVLDAGQDPDDGSLYIALELLTGIDLATYLMRYEKLLPSETLTVVCQVLQALIVAHAAGVVHRDIKPENIFLARLPTGETHVKIVDFGISKVLNPEKDINLSITQSNTTVGTPHYMSPEQAKGEPIDPRADIWALGVVMYECLTGQLPFDGENFNLQIVAVVTEHHKPASDFEVEPGLSAIVDKCLQKDRNRRFASASEMLEALKTYLDEHPDTAVRPSLLRAPMAHELPPAARARPNDPTAAMPVVKGPAAVTAGGPGELPPQDTMEQLPVFPGMVPIDEETPADSMPTTVRAVVAGGAAPKPLSQRPGALRSDPPPALARPMVDLPPLPKRTSLAPPPMPKDLAVPGELEGAPAGAGSLEALDTSAPGVSTEALSPSMAPEGRRSRASMVAIGAAVVALTAGVAGAALSKLHTAARPPQSVNTVRVRFTRMPPEAQPVVSGVRYFSNEAYITRGARPVTVRIEAPGYQPLQFNLVPERDQDVVLPAMARLTEVPVAPAAPTPPPPSARPEPAPSPAPAAAAPSVDAATPTAAPVRQSAPSSAPRQALALPTSIAPGISPTTAAASRDEGQLSIGASPRCQISIDGQEVGPTPVYHRPTAAGEHRLRCAREGGAVVERTVTVTAGRNERVMFDE
ncbi:MAG: protein kinase [Myxococcales bacterium]|nr:protein kinase [Myxococcales bacterium]